MYTVCYTVAAKIIETHSPVLSDNYGFHMDMSIWKP